MASGDTVLVLVLVEERLVLVLVPGNNVTQLQAYSSWSCLTG
jgi:hypothetical protein